MIHCGPHEGRHTGVLVAKKLDEVINELELPENDCFKTMTTDNASNMKIACRDSLTIDKHLSCFDHSLNLVVNAGINSVALLKTAVDNCRKLVTGCHKSNLYCERIKRACSDLNSSLSTVQPGNSNNMFRENCRLVSINYYISNVFRENYRFVLEILKFR